MSKSITKEEAMMVINELEEQTKRPVCKVNLTKEKCSIFDSKMGGIPYYPINKILPVDENGKQLWLLAQIILSRCQAYQISQLKEYYSFLLL